MTRGREPIRDDLRELVGGHAGMGRHEHLKDAVLARFGERLHVAFERGLERLLVLPLRMLRSEHLHAVEREGQLNWPRLFGPQRSIVVKHRDALGWDHEIRRALPGDCGDESDDRLFRRAVVPGWQRVLGARRAG